MIELTVGGKDFLKYVTHADREANQRTFLMNGDPGGT